MTDFNPIFPQSRVRLRRTEPALEYIQPQRVLQRILAFTGQSIDDVVNHRVSKNIVAGHYKLFREIKRQGEVRELEDQWNSVRL
jgi:hypothetical protein